MVMRKPRKHILTTVAPSLIMFLPHQSQNPRRVLYVDTRHSLVQSTELLKDERPLRGTAAFCASDEGRPNEAFEVRVRVWHGTYLTEEIAGHGGVVGGEADVRPGRGVAFPGTRQHTASVEVDGVLVGPCEGNAGGEVGEVMGGLHVVGPGYGVEVVDALEEGEVGFQREGLALLCGGREGGGLGCCGGDFGVGVPEGVDEEDHFEEVGGAADPGGFFETLEHGGAHGGGVEWF